MAKTARPAQQAARPAGGAGPKFDLPTKLIHGLGHLAIAAFATRARPHQVSGARVGQLSLVFIAILAALCAGSMLARSPPTPHIAQEAVAR